MVFTYSAKDLKKQFSELRQLDNLTIVPLMNIILCDFLVDLQSNYEKYNITGFDVLEEFNKRTVFSDTYVATISTVAVKIKVAYLNIYVTDGGFAWYMPASIMFNSGDTHKFAQNLHAELKEFIKRQKISELITKAKSVLKKAKPKHLISEIAEFYLE